MDLVGTRLAGNRYHLTEIVGQGEMGAVYAADDTLQKRRVAIKVLDAETALDPARVERFRREHDVSKRLSHPNIPEVYELGPTPEGGWFLVMELLRGKTLEDQLQEGELLPAEEVARIAAQVASALGLAHEHGLIHRDVAPKNIMLVREGGLTNMVKLVDWGAVKFAEDDEDEAPPPDEEVDDDDLADHKDLTAVGVRLGTPNFMAPEYIELGYCDGRSDLYSLGATMYRLITGELPFTGSMLQVMEAHIEDEPAPPSARSDNCPRWLEAIILRLMAKRPDHRIQQADELIQALETGTDTSLLYYPATFDEDRSVITVAKVRSTALREPLMLAVGCLLFVFMGLVCLFLVALLWRLA